MVFDVTREAKPLLVRRIPWPEGAASGNLALFRSGVGLSTTSPSAKIQQHLPVPETTLEVLDLRDPANPQVVKTFTGVTSVLSDDARSLIYLTNKDGLWVIRQEAQDSEEEYSSGG